MACLVSVLTLTDVIGDTCYTISGRRLTVIEGCDRCSLPNTGDMFPGSLVAMSVFLETRREPGPFTTASPSAAAGIGARHRFLWNCHVVAVFHE